MRYFRIPMFLVVLLIVDAILGSFLRPYYRAVALPSFEHFYAQYVTKEHDADIIFFGDSRIQHGVDSAALSDVCTCVARNIAVSGSNMVTTYYQMRDYLATHNPEAVVIGVHWSRLAPQPNGHHYPFLLELLPLRDALEYVFMSRDLEFVARMILRSYRYQEALPRFVRGVMPTPQATSTDEFFPLNAAFHESDIEFATFNQFHTFDQPVDPTQVAYFERTLALIQEHDIPIIVVHPPELFAIRQYIAHFEELNANLAQIVTEYGGTYIDMNTVTEPLTQDESAYVDVLHLNAAGARDFSRTLGERLETIVSAQ